MKVAKIVLAMGIFITILSVNATFAQEMVTAGLVSFWTFDAEDIVGDTVRDVWGNNHGTMEGGPESVAGKIDQALSFDGDDDYVEVAHSVSLDIVSEITIEFWFVLKGESGNNDWPRLVSKGQSTDFNSGYGVWVKDISGPNDIGFRSVTLAPNDVRSTTLPDYNDGAWHHVMVTYDGSTGKLFLDGEKHVDAPTSGDIAQTEKPLHIGDANNERFFNGLIDEVRIYNRALSEDEVLQNFGVRSNLLAVEPNSKLTTSWGNLKIQ